MDEELIKKQLVLNRRKLIADIVLIIFVAILFIYIFSEIENFKAVGSNVCRLCELKTNGICTTKVLPN